MWRVPPDYPSPPTAQCADCNRSAMAGFGAAHGYPSLGMGLQPGKHGLLLLYYCLLLRQCLLCERSRRLASFVGDTDVRTRLEQHFGNLRMTLLRRRHERGISVNVDGIEPDAGLRQQEFDHLLVS